MDSDKQSQNEHDDRQALSWYQVVGSVLASFFGVQSRANRERDFTHGNAWHFIVIGVVMTLVFIGVIVAIVQLILNRAGL